MNWELPLFEIYWDEDGVEAVTNSIRAEINWEVGPNIGKFEEVNPWRYRFDPTNRGSGR